MSFSEFSQTSNNGFQFIHYRFMCFWYSSKCTYYGHDSKLNIPYLSQLLRNIILSIYLVLLSIIIIIVCCLRFAQHELPPNFNQILHETSFWPKISKQMRSHAIRERKICKKRERNLYKIREVPISRIFFFFLYFIYFRATRNLFHIFVCYFPPKSPKQKIILLDWLLLFF